MSTAENKALVRRWVAEVVNTGDLSDQSPASQLIAPDFVGHLVSLPEIHGFAAFRQVGISYFSAFPDLQLTLEDLIAEGDKVAVRYRSRGTHRGELMGISATGKPVTVAGISIYRLAEGQIAELWDMPDNLGMLQQLGVVPPPS